MNLNSARQYKTELLHLTQQAARQMRFKMADPSRKPRLTIGIGLAPTRIKDGDFKVTVRVPPGIPDPVLEAILPHSRPAELEVVKRITYTSRSRFQPGCSIGHRDITAGTLGGFVKDSSGTYLLSNNHVLANCDVCSVGDPTLFPGPADVSGDPPAIVGELARWIPLRGGTPNVIDAAISRSNLSIDINEARRYEGIGVIDPRPILDRFAVTRVIKTGRTTGVTRGKVMAQELDAVVVEYSSNGPSFAVEFNGLVEVSHSWRTRHFSRGGDSGSLILDAETLRPFALLFAGGKGADGRDRTLAHYLPEVLRQLDVEMV